MLGDILFCSAVLGLGFYVFIHHLINVGKRKERTVDTSAEDRELLSWMLVHVDGFKFWLQQVERDYRVLDDFIDCVELQYKTAILFEICYHKGVFTKPKFRHLLLSEDNLKSAETHCWKNFKTLILQYQNIVVEQVRWEQQQRDGAIAEYSTNCK